MAHLKDSFGSTDILFPEDHSLQSGDDSFYSPPSNSSYSSYSIEIKNYMQDRRYKRSHSEDQNTDYAHVNNNYRSPMFRSSVSLRTPLSQSVDNFGNTTTGKSSTPHGSTGKITPHGSTGKNTPQRHIHIKRADEYIDNYTVPEKQDFASRRRTWSPPTAARIMGSVSSIHSIRSYHSNDKLDDVDESPAQGNEPREKAPPKITPVSGIPSKSPGNVLIRPIAFKPVVPSSRYVSPTQQSRDHKSANNSLDDGYSSQEFRSTSHSHSTSNLSQGSLQLDNSDRSLGCGSENGKLVDRPDSFNSSNLSRMSGCHMEGYTQTPSPSDSGVGEMEAILRDKDAEIRHLRDTMEHNEKVIFQVYEEKQQNWQVELKEMHERWEKKLKMVQQRAFKMEQALLMQLFKLQQDKKELQEECGRLRDESTAFAQKSQDLENEVRNMNTTMDESKWDMGQKLGEISHLKKQLKDSIEKTGNKNNEAILFKTQIKDMQDKLDIKEIEVEKSQDVVKAKTEQILELENELKKLRNNVEKPLSETAVQTDEGMNMLLSAGDTDRARTEISKKQEEIGNLQETIEKERDQWLDEKNKVIRYQKQLQLNYVQMYRKNRMLEGEIEQLTIELENRDMKILAENEESTC